MKIIFFLTIVFILVVPGISHSKGSSFNWQKIKEEARNYVSKHLGNEVATEIFGPTLKKISLPEIPKGTCGPKSSQCATPQEEINEGQLSAEQKEKYNLIFLKEVFKATRNRKADRNFIVKWMNIMEQGASREGIYRSLVLDNTYAGLENFENPLNDATMDFSIHFLETYLDKKISRKSLERMNLYTLKRIITEKTLEVVDELSRKPKELSRWYAVFSAELAKSYPHLWKKNKVRSNGSAHFHLAWANKAPSQYLKSEIIIKIHSLLNDLN